MQLHATLLIICGPDSRVLVNSIFFSREKSSPSIKGDFFLHKVRTVLKIF